MEYDRGGKRGRNSNRRFTGRGYRRGNVRGNYHPWRPNWHNHYHNLYTFRYSEKPPSPLPGTEEYRQRNIQQTSELIKKQLNVDSDTCNNTNLNIQSETNVTEQPKSRSEEEEHPPSAVASEQKKQKNKKSQIEKEDTDVQGIYDKIVKHIASLSHSKKLNLINQSNSGYDIAIQQIQKQKQLELSKALRDMSQRPMQDTDEEVIQSIVPDIGIKLEDLPNNVIEELSKTLQIKFEYDEVPKIEVGETQVTGENQVVDMNISPFSETANEEIDSASKGVIDNIFDFEYLNKTESFEDTLTENKDLPEPTDEPGLSFANIDVTKSYLELIDLPISSNNELSEEKQSDYDLLNKFNCAIRVKTDIFESPEKEKRGSKSSNEQQQKNINTSNLKSHQSKQQNISVIHTIPLSENPSTSNIVTTSENSVLSQQNTTSLILAEDNLTPSAKPSTSKLNSGNDNTDSSKNSFNSPVRQPSPDRSPSTEPSTSKSNVTTENLNVVTNQNDKTPSPPPTKTKSVTSNLDVNNENSNSSTTSEQRSSSATSSKADATNEISNSAANNQKYKSQPPLFEQQYPYITNNSNLTISTQNNPFSKDGNESINDPSSSTSLQKAPYISPFDHQNAHVHISPLLRDLQTPPHQPTTDLGTRKKWKSPGEKKMIPCEAIVYRPECTITTLEQANRINEIDSEEIKVEEVCKEGLPVKPADFSEKPIPESDIQKQDENQSTRRLSSEQVSNKQLKDKSKRNSRRRKDRGKRRITSDDENDVPSKMTVTERPQNKIPNVGSENVKICKEIGVMVNMEKYKRRRKVDIQIQTEDVREQKVFKAVGTMTNEKRMITVSAQTPMKFFKKNLQVKAVQTGQINCKNVEIQATERMKNASIQTEKGLEESAEKYAAYMAHLKLMQDIDDQIKQLLAKRTSLYEATGFLSQEVGNKHNLNKKKKTKKNKNDKRSENEAISIIKRNQPGPKCSKIKDTLMVDEAKKIEQKDVDTTEDNNAMVEEKSNLETEEIVKKCESLDKSKTFLEEGNKLANKPVKTQSRELKDDRQKSEQRDIDISVKQPPKQVKEVEPQDKNKSLKSPAEETKQPEADNKPLKISLKVEKDENNIKKYSLKRERSRSLSKDREHQHKPKRSTPQPPTDCSASTSQQTDKQFKLSKDIESLIYSDNKFMKKCCVKIKPLKAVPTVSEQTKEIGDAGMEKEFESLEESGTSPRDQIEKEVNSSNPPIDNVPSPHSACSTSSTSSGRQKSKVIDKLEFKGLMGSVFALKAMDDELLAAGDDGTLYFFNVITQGLINSVNLSTQPLTSLHTLKTTEECLIYATCLDGNLRIVDAANKALQKTIDIGYPIQCMDISWGYAFLGSTTGELNIYNIKMGKLDNPIKIFDDRIYAIKTMQEGARRVLLMGAKDTELSVRDAMTGLLMRTVETVYNPTIYSILNYQNLVYCGTNQHDVLVYSFQDGHLVKKYEGIASRRVVCMQIVDNLLFVGCFNGSVCVFHKNTHQYLGHMIRPGESLLSMLIVNNKVIVGLKNNKLVSWDVPVVYLEKNR